MTTPLATIADALIAFILSLLQDPALTEDFLADPDNVLAGKGLGDACGEDVRAVAPVIIERPEVSPGTGASPQPPTYGPQPPAYRPPEVSPANPDRPEVVNEIMKLVNNFTIENRTTIVDQSVNQNIWAQGDVMQHFDQKAIIAAGNESLAAGEDATIDTSTTQISTGDVAIGNKDLEVTVDDSFNGEDTTTQASTDVEVEGSFNDTASAVAVDGSTAGAAVVDTGDTTIAPESEPSVSTYEETTPAPEPEPEASPDASAAALNAEEESSGAEADLLDAEAAPQS